MEPGRELDALVAEKVFGKTVSWGGDPGGTIIPWLGDLEGIQGECPAYSTDIASAWEVVDWVSAIEWGFALFHYPGLSSNGFGYVVAFARSLRPYSLEIVTLGDPEKVKHAHSNDLPHAICLAALKTCE